MKKYKYVIRYQVMVHGALFEETTDELVADTFKRHYLGIGTWTDVKIVKKRKRVYL